MPKRKISDSKAAHKKIRYKESILPNKNIYEAQGTLNEYYSKLKRFPTPNCLGDMNNISHGCGTFMLKNETHSGTINVNAKFFTCCNQGKIILPCITDPPDLIKHLISDDSKEGKHFRHHIRAFDSSLAFASLGVKEDILPAKGPYTYLSLDWLQTIKHIFFCIFP